MPSSGVGPADTAPVSPLGIRRRTSTSSLTERAWTWLATRRLGPALGLLAGVLLLGTVGFMTVGGLGPLDAAYQAVITVTTAGFQDLTTSATARVFITIYALLGMAAGALAVSALSAVLVEGRLRVALGRRRMERQVSGLSDHLILCGYGRFGQVTADEIRAAGVPLVVVDADPKSIEAAEEHGVLALLGDATEDDTLERAGLPRARALLCSLPSDADNVYIILTARERRRDLQIVALARDRKAERRLLASGADHVVSPYTIGALHMARQVLSPHVAHVMNIAGSGPGRVNVGVSMSEHAIGPGAPLVGMALRDSPLRRSFGVMVVAVMDLEGSTHFNPGPDHVLREGDVIVCVGRPEGLERLGAWLAGRASAPPPGARP